MLSVWPSQIDTWLNLLPNAAYLFDHDRLPTAQLPPSYSFLPVAPYNTQFADYLASLAAGGLADGAMGLFNAALLCAAALLLARALAGTAEGTPPWWACAVGLLLVGPLNPGFVPRFFISPYGEAPLAVTALFAVWLAAEFLGDLARGIAWPRSLAPLALVLAALVNTKQSGIGLLVPIGVTMLVLARADPAITARRALPAIAAALVPSVALYLLWRAFVLNSGFAAGELKPYGVRRLEHRAVASDHPRPVGGDVPESHVLPVRGGAAGVGGTAAAARSLEPGRSAAGHDCRRRHPVQRLPAVHLCRAFPARVGVGRAFILSLQHAGLAPGHAWPGGGIAALGGGMVGGERAPLRSRAGRAAVGLALLFPVAGVPLLRFDRDTPQPELRRLGHEAAAYLQPGDRLALLLPGDSEDSIGSFLRGVHAVHPAAPPGTGLPHRDQCQPSHAGVCRGCRLPAGAGHLRAGRPRWCAGRRRCHAAGDAGWLACPANLGVARADQATAIRRIAGAGPAVRRPATALTLNPRTELGSHVGLAVVIGVFMLCGGTVRWHERVWFGAIILAMGTQAYGEWIHRPTDVWLKPLLALVFAVWLVGGILWPPRPRGCSWR